MGGAGRPHPHPCPRALLGQCQRPARLHEQVRGADSPSVSSCSHATAVCHVLPRASCMMKHSPAPPLQVGAVLLLTGRFECFEMRLLSGCQMLGHAPSAHLCRVPSCVCTQLQRMHVCCVPCPCTCTCQLCCVAISLAGFDHPGMQTQLWGHHPMMYGALSPLNPVLNAVHFCILSVCRVPGRSSRPCAVLRRTCPCTRLVHATHATWTTTQAAGVCA